MESARSTRRAAVGWRALPAMLALWTAILGWLYSPWLTLAGGVVFALWVCWLPTGGDW